MDVVTLKTVVDVLLTWFFVVLTCLMFAGAACFSAGMVRAKSTIDIFAKYFIALAISAFCYFIWGHCILQSSTALLSGYFPSAQFEWPNFANPQDRSILFFNLFAHAIPLAVIIGATAERLKLWSFILFSFIACLFLFPLIGFWVVGQGYLHHFGFWDVTGSSASFLSGSCAALACLFLIGPRQGRYSGHYLQIPRPANIPLAALGVFLFWIGSAGYLAGNYWITGIQATQPHWMILLSGIQSIGLNTMSASVGAILSALLLLRLFNRRVEIDFLMVGLMAGIVSIAPSPQMPSAQTAFLVGVGGSVFALLGLFYLEKKHIDDPSGMLASFGMGSIWGLLASVATRGFSAPRWDQLLSIWARGEAIQIIGILLILGTVFLVSLMIWLSIRYLIGLRVRSQDEFKGLDIIDYGAPAYPEFTDFNKN